MRRRRFFMIDTVIFDIGNVLTEWHWHDSFVEWFGEDLVDTLANATVMSPEWAEIDRGVLTEEEVVALLTKNAPDYPEQIRRIVHDSHELVTVYPYAADWVRDLKKKGYKVYILSNFSEFGFNRVKDTFDFLPYADGALISYEVKLVKPDRKIYETLCERFDITPENAVFLDDNAKNTEAAREFGLHAITVENKEQTDRDLHVLGVTW